MVKRNGTVRRLIVKAALAAVMLMVLQGIVTSLRGAKDTAEDAAGDTMKALMLREAAKSWGEVLYDLFVPGISFAEEGQSRGCWVLQEQLDGLVPLYGYVYRDMQEEQESETSYREILLAEAEGEDSPQAEQDVSEKQAVEGIDRSLAELLQEENEAAMQLQEGVNTFVPHGLQQQVDITALQDYETLLNQFYTVDSNTMVGSDQLNVNSLLEKDMTVSKDGDGPQILIFHTHSQESFADSVPGDTSTTIVGVGERLTQILTEEYGYNVLHHTAAYDADTRDDAYSRALPGVEQVLAENPSIQVVIDLHRDEMPEETRLVMDLDGRPTARFMFFNGLSRTKKTGNIAYLYNENLEDNLAFSFQMQLKAAEYYPGLTRKIYLKGYRYNMHLRDKYLLIELGAQNNTVEEAMNACDPLAHILDLVLSGSGE